MNGTRTNDEIRPYDKNNSLALIERGFAAITQALIKQNETAQESFRGLMDWATSAGRLYKALGILLIKGATTLAPFLDHLISKGRLNHRALLKHCQELLLQNTQHRYRIPDAALKELQWWQVNLAQFSPIHYPPVTEYLLTDASAAGWGAQLNNLRLSGLWSVNEANSHSNQREMRAIWYTLKDHCRHLVGSSLLIQSDNRTVVSYLRNEGGTKSHPLMEMTYKIFNILDLYNIHMVAQYIPGRYNGEADQLSRLTYPPEWHLLPQITSTIFSKWGRPVIDLFASSIAHVVPVYSALDVRDQKAHFHDAFSQEWHYPLAWVFPPPFLIPRVLQHLNSATGIYLIVVPRWTKVFWRPDLKNRALSPPFTIWNLEQVLVDATTSRPPPLVSEITLEVWRCGGGPKVL
ncbi:uncharacterized protein LOC113238110 [Hyposmocoma kahamanoa]|uniref:uncharacterized protein LOC113238110 n=1 Tax=Hyposmocoma kahamanoa TaxID=1477025 RepID=UPI000E6D70FA|nr:uncharacterized protein LOC113238110 [Hyposmocoma kahamanoa]